MDNRPYTKIDTDLKDGKLSEEASHLGAVSKFVREFMGIGDWSGNVQITLTQADVKEEARKAIDQ